MEALEEGFDVTLEKILEENGKYDLTQKLPTMEWEDKESVLGIIDEYYFTINEDLEVTIGEKVSGLFVSVSNISGNQINGIYTSNVKVSLKGTFEKGNLVGVYYSLDGGNTYQEGTEINLIAEEKQGKNTIKYKAKGIKDEEEIETREKELVINIDSESPIISNVQISEVTDTSAILTVTATDKTTGIKEYEYYVKAQNEEEYVLKLKNGDFENKIDNLEPLTTYSIMVVAVDHVQNRSNEFKKDVAFKTIDNLEPWQRLLVLAEIDHSLYSDFSSSLTTTNTTAIANSSVAMNYIGNLFSNSEYFRLIANNNTLIKAVCENSNARLSMYNNYAVTQSILASSSVAINAMKASSRYAVASGSSTESFVQCEIKTKLLYNGKAFVLSISQKSWNDTRTQYQTIHGYYIDGTRHGNFGTGYTNAQINSTYGNNGLRKTVYKFASVVRMHPNWYINGSTTEAGVNCYAAIFKI